MIINKHFLALTIAASLIPDFVSAEERIIVNAERANSQNKGRLSQQANIGLLGNKDIQDIPFSIKGYTSKYIEERQAKNAWRCNKRRSLRSSDISVRRYS